MDKADEHGGGNRNFHRISCRSEGTLDVRGAQLTVSLVDASRGGFKLKAIRQDDLGRSVGVLPREFRMQGSHVDAEGSVLWATGGMMGCHFYEHITLDGLAELMAGGFHLRLTHP